jgi:xylulokinase
VPEGAPVSLAGHDHLAGADGCGADEEDLVNSVGTAETVIGRCRRIPDRARALSLPTAVTVSPGGAGWATLASAARSGIVLGQVADLLGLDPENLDELAAATDEVAVPDVIEAVGRGDRPVLPSAPPGAVWAGVLHALAGRTVEASDRIMALTGPSPRLVVFGGGSRSRPWLEAKAAAATTEVWRSSTEEAVSRGAALRAGMAAGWWPSPAGAPKVALERIRAY